MARSRAGRARAPTQVDVFLNAESEVAHFAEVALVQFVFFDFEALLQDLLGLLAANGAEDADLLVTTDAERSHGVASFGEHGRLAGQLFEHFRRTGQTITGFADANVQAQFTDAQIAHDVLGLVLLRHAPGGCRRRASFRWALGGSGGGRWCACFRRFSSGHC